MRIKICSKPCQFISPKGQWSEGSIVRRVNGLKGQQSEGSIVRQVRSKSNFERPRDYKFMYRYNIELHKTLIEMVAMFSCVIIHPFRQFA